MVVPYSYAGTFSTPENVCGFLQTIKGCFVSRAVRNGLDRSYAEDSFQEVAFKSLRRVSQGYTFDDPTSLKKWAYRVHLNYCRDFFRKKKANNLGDADGDVLSGSDFLEQVEGTDDIGRLNMAIEKLPDIYRQAILGIIKMKPYQEIATDLGLNLKTVSTRIHRAKLHLKKDLEDIAVN